MKLVNLFLQLLPKHDFLNLLRDVGASGTKTPVGEVFTLNAVSFCAENCGSGGLFRVRLKQKKLLAMSGQ